MVDEEVAHFSAAPRDVVDDAVRHATCSGPRDGVEVEVTAAVPADAAHFVALRILKRQNRQHDTEAGSREVARAVRRERSRDCDWSGVRRCRTCADHQKAGAVKILALTTDQRDPALPDVPSVTELGYPQLKASYWTALHAPKGTPDAIVQTYAAAAIKTVRSERFRTLLVANGQTEKAGGPQALEAQLESDRQYWGKVIQENRIVLD